MVEGGAPGVVDSDERELAARLDVSPHGRRQWGGVQVRLSLVRAHWSRLAVGLTFGLAVAGLAVGQTLLILAPVVAGLAVGLARGLAVAVAGRAVGPTLLIFGLTLSRVAAAFCPRTVEVSGWDLRTRRRGM